MALFAKKQPPKDLPIISTEQSDTIALYVNEIIGASKRIYALAQTVPGLVDYCVTSLVPRLATAGAMGQIDKAIGILAADAVLGGTIAIIARSLKGKDNA